MSVPGRRRSRTDRGLADQAARAREAWLTSACFLLALIFRGHSVDGVMSAVPDPLPLTCSAEVEASHPLCSCQARPMSTFSLPSRTSVRRPFIPPAPGSGAHPESPGAHPEGAPGKGSEKREPRRRRASTCLRGRPAGSSRSGRQGSPRDGALVSSRRLSSATPQAALSHPVRRRAHPERLLAVRRCCRDLTVTSRSSSVTPRSRRGRRAGCGHPIGP